MSAFTDFETKYNGQPVEVEDPTNVDQCMDLAFAWCDWINVPRETIRHLYAYQVWTQPFDSTLQYFECVPNTPNGVPPEGALVIFNTNVGVAGHIAIATGKGDAKSFVSFDQNWSGAKYAKEVTHSYSSVSGWLVRRSSVQPCSPVILEQSDAFIAVSSKLNTVANKDLVLAEIDKLIAIEDQAPAKDKQLSDANTQISTLQDKISQLQIDHETLTKELAEQAKTVQSQEEQINILSGEIDALKKQITTPVFKGWKKALINLISKL